ncbi:MAG TPA: FIST N-terminal domain-containing protein [Polyangiaceae bacterium]|nr:FIST N-terminal domain-containing protein [Polyangiaceae bacterium]
MSSAATVALATSDVGALAQPLRALRAQVGRPGAGFLFLTGNLAAELLPAARALAAAWPGVPALVATGAGVLTERGEFEGQSAACALLVGGTSARALWLEPEGPDELAPLLGRALEGGAPRALALFAEPHLLTPRSLRPLPPGAPARATFGGGVATSPGLAVVTAEGAVERAPAAAIAFGGPLAPHVAVFPSMRPVGPFRTITQAQAGLVLQLDGEPALDALAADAEGLTKRPQLYAFVADAPEAGAAPSPKGRARPLRGVDPGKRAVLVADDVAEGDRLAFAVLDPGAARAHLEAGARELGQRAAGAAARFGLYVNCAGRGRGLYNAADVDVRALRARFPDTPFAGLLSSCELAPGAGGLDLHYFTGVFGLFTAPS